VFLPSNKLSIYTKLAEVRHYRQIPGRKSSFYWISKNYFFAMLSKKSNIQSENQKKPSQYINCSVALRATEQIGRAHLQAALPSKFDK